MSREWILYGCTLFRHIVTVSWDRRFLYWHRLLTKLMRKSISDMKNNPPQIHIYCNSNLYMLNWSYLRSSTQHSVCLGDKKKAWQSSSRSEGFKQKKDQTHPITALVSFGHRLLKLRWQTARAQCIWIRNKSSAHVYIPSKTWIFAIGPKWQTPTSYVGA